jgi:hypothetical protein
VDYRAPVSVIGTDLIGTLFTEVTFNGVAAPDFTILNGFALHGVGVWLATTGCAPQQPQGRRRLGHGFHRIFEPVAIASLIIRAPGCGGTAAEVVGFAGPFQSTAPRPD